MGGTCDVDADNSEIAAAVLTIPQTINTNNLTGTIEYQYHTCSSNCYSAACTGTMKYVSGGGYNDDNGNHHYFHRCDKCGNTGYSGNSGSYGCGKKNKICGYSDGQLIGATISY